METLTTTQLTETTLKTDKQLLVFTHLSQLLDFVTGFGGFIVPLVLWLVKKDEIDNMDQTGKDILNFRISMFIYALICIPLIFALGLGILGLIAIGLLSLIMPIVNAIKVNNGEPYDYPFSMEFLK